MAKKTVPKIKNLPGNEAISLRINQENREVANFITAVESRIQAGGKYLSEVITSAKDEKTPKKVQKILRQLLEEAGIDF
jgi:hypothetical protein